MRYAGGVMILEGAPGKPVVIRSGPNRIEAQHVELDKEKQTLKARDTVTVERQVEVVRSELRAETLQPRSRRELVTETMHGDDLFYDYGKGVGRLNNARLRLVNFNIATAELEIEGKHYTAHNVVLRPGGLSEEEERVYGRPPFNLRAKTVSVDSATREPQLSVAGAGLYFKNTRIIPVPSHVFRASGVGRNSREDKAFEVVPRLAYNSVDGPLLTTSARFALDRKHPERLSLKADIGLSGHIGFRGGASVEAGTPWGTLALRGRKNDIVTTQLTNRIEVDRQPELEFASPLLPLFDLPGKRRAGLAFVGSLGRYHERSTGSNTGDIESTRRQAIVAFTTRYNQVDGPYVELFAGTSHYSLNRANYRTTGFEIGYDGSITRFIRGQFSYRSNSISGASPFRFDTVEIARELRTTFDVNLSKRYIIPIDLRYDLDLDRLRDERFGLLRSYKTFAYGFTYQTARHELRLDLRRAF